MDIQNRIEKKFDSTGYKTMINGETVDINELSRDDLIQVVCDGMNALSTLESLQIAAAGVMERWVWGRPQDSLTEIGNRLIADDPDGPAE
jgi:hypothetical protein